MICGARPAVSWLSFLHLMLLLGLLAPGRAQTQEALDCAPCHETAAKLASSQHGKVGCQECHQAIKEFPHPEKAAKPDCGACHPQQAGEHARSVHGRALRSGNAAAPDCATCHGGPHEVSRATSPEFVRNVPELCGACHSDVSAEFQESVHGKAVARGIADAPTCVGCHGEHSIASPKSATSSVHPNHIRETCGRCHGDVRLARKFGLPADRLTSFDASFHGLAAKSGSQTVANCASCHGFHGILPSSDPKSMTHAGNLAKTCGSCHPGAGARFALGTIHWADGKNEPAPVRYTRLAYIGIITLTIGLMALHHLGDYFRKLFSWSFRGHRPPPLGALLGELRMLPIERVEHAILAISFIVLAWSGFALKYPEQLWAKPLVMWESSWPVRGTLHRAAAVVMTLAGVFHVITLIVSKRLREHWRELLPRRSDVYEGLAQLAYNLGLRRQPPRLSPHGYVEKAEYWAVVWGTFVMGLTGLILWANNYSLRLLPKTWIDVATTIHFYEAVLASLAIVVWHFYTVIFDPVVYPMDPAWFTGRSGRPRGQPQHRPGQASATEGSPRHELHPTPGD